MTRTMTLRRFRKILESYGAAPARWPEAERAAALHLMKADPKARDFLAREAALDGTLDGLPRPEAADPAFVKRLTAIPFQSVPGAHRPVRKARGWGGMSGLFGRRALVPQGLALALAGVFGIWLGLHSGVSAQKSIVEIDAGAYFAFNPDLEKDLEEFR